MKLLVVTGIVNSSWWPIYSALNTSIKKMIDTVPDCNERIHQLIKQKEVITASKLEQVLNIQEDDNDYIFGDEQQIISLAQWATLPQIKFVIFLSKRI